jgi:Brp/Blh family beta-carotene 15,15'-monooxygenase
MIHKSSLYNAILILSFLALWLSVQIPESLEYNIGYFLILTIGVGHGANDLKIYFKNQNLDFKKSARFISIYATGVLLGFLAFFVIPDLVLLLFLIISGFHFGQEHFERFELTPSVTKNIFITAYGLLIIMTLLYLKASFSLPIIHDLITNTITVTQLQWTVYTLAAVTVLTGIVILKKLPIALLIRELFYLVILYVIFTASSLVWGFAIYFVLWHSIPSINHQIEHLHGSVTRSTIIKYIKESILFWIAAIIFLGALYYFLNEKTALFLSIIVAFLGGITFPHVIVMHKIHK